MNLQSMAFIIVVMPDRFSKLNKIAARFSKWSKITCRFNSTTNLTILSFWVTKMNKGLFSYLLVSHCVTARLASNLKGRLFFFFLITNLVLIHSLVTAGFALSALHAGLLWGILIKGFLKSYSNVSRVMSRGEHSRKLVNCLWLLTMCALREQRECCLWIMPPAMPTS